MCADFITDESEIKLNIGAGKTYVPGFTNIDIDDKADITVDLNNDPLPFDANSIDVIFSYHLLEHLENYLFCLGEIHRILKHGGRLFIGVPYVTLTEYNLVNPYHKQNFNEYSFDFFDAEKLKGSAAEATPILFHKVFHRFHYMSPFKSRYIPDKLRHFCRRHMFNVVSRIDFGLVAVKQGVDFQGEFFHKPSFVQEFDHYNDSRESWPKK